MDSMILAKLLYSAAAVCVMAIGVFGMYAGVLTLRSVRRKGNDYDESL